VSIDPIEAGLAASETFLSQVDQLIKSQILASWPDKVPGLDSIARTLDGLIAKAETALQNAEKAIKTQIDPLIRNAIPNALDFLGSITQSLDTHLGQLIGNIATTEDVLGSAISVLKGQAPELARWLYDNVTGGFGNIALGVLRTIETENPEAIDPLLDELLKIPNLPPFIRTAAESARSRTAPFFAFILPALLLAALLPALGALTEPSTLAVRQGAFDLLPTREADTGVLTDSVIRGLITEERFRHGMRQNGLNDDVSLLYLRTRQQILEPDVATRAYIRGDLDRAQWEGMLGAKGVDPEKARTFWQASLTLLNETDARESFLRGLKSEEEHDAILNRLGYTADSAKLRRSLYFYIPPAQDLIHMAIRNVFNPEIVERFQLFGDFPPPFEEAARMQGISRTWAERYWGAHWIVPGNEEAFAMFQRTLDEPLDENADEIRLSDGSTVHNIIGGSTLRLLLREKDIAPFYRDKLTQLAYHPLTRIDIRRLAALGLLDHAGVERGYLDLGYSQKNALRLADFTDALTKRQRKDEAAQLVDGLRRQALRLYVQGKLEDAEIDSTLSDLQFTGAEIEVFKAEALLVARAERITRIETRIGKLYIAGLIDAAEAEKRLEDHGIPVSARTQLFAEWDLDIEYRGGSEHIHKHRELTKSEILEALIDGMVDVPTATSMIQAIGYDENGATAEVSLALFKAAKATKRTQIDAIKAAYVNGVIELLEASNRLDALHVQGDQRDAYLAEWTLSRETRTERIPIATLRDMVKGDYLTEDEAFPHLKRHRFTDDDANLLLKFWKNQQAPKRLVHA